MALQAQDEDVASRRLGSRRDFRGQCPTTRDYTDLTWHFCLDFHYIFF